MISRPVMDGFLALAFGQSRGMHGPTLAKERKRERKKRTSVSGACQMGLSVFEEVSFKAF